MILILGRMEQAKIWGCITPLRMMARNLKLMVYFWKLSINVFKLWSFPGGSVGKESICLQCRRYRRHRFNLWVRKTSWRRAWQPTPVLLPGEPHGGAWQATVHGVAKSRHSWRNWASTHACLNCDWPQVTQTVESESGYRRDHRICSYEVDSQVGRMLTSQRMRLETWNIKKESGGLRQWDMRTRGWNDPEVW